MVADVENAYGKNKQKEQNSKEKRMRNIFLKMGMKNGLLLILYVITTFILSEILIVGNDYIAKATDTMLSGEAVNFQGFIVPLTIMIIGGTVIAYIKSLAGNHYSVQVQRDVRAKLGTHLMELPYCYFDEKGTGNIMTKLISDIGETGRFFSEVLPELLVNVITVLTVTVYLVQMDIFLIIVLFASYPIMLLIADWLSRRLTTVVKRWRSRMDERTEIAYDSIQGIVVGRSFNLYRNMKRRIDGVIDDIAEQGCRSTKITSMGYVMKNSVSMIPIIICYLFALNETIKGKITIGQMLAFTVLLGRILYPIGDIVFSINDIRQIGVSFGRIQDIFNHESEVGGTEVIDWRGDDSSTDNTMQGNHVDVPVIQWNDITFSYDGKRDVLRKMSFDVKCGEQVAFAGGSGEGKSTIFRILCGFYEKAGGSYQLFGHEFANCSLESARNCFSLVSQNVFLFPKTIEENVAFGRENVTHEEVVKACKSANIHDFIMNLPEGYNTMVGERGVLLSGGERQRISIARAFLKDAPILLLDEPTASVDVGTETMIQEAINRISEGRTVMIIAHRLSTIQNCDRIYVVNQGGIAEVGTHDELLEQDGIYAGMYGKEVAANE